MAKHPAGNAKKQPPIVEVVAEATNHEGMEQHHPDDGDGAQQV